MNMMIAAWRAFPAAPETRRLRQLRVHSIAGLMLTAMLVAWNHLLWVIHPFAVTLIPVAGLHAVMITGRYWVAKNRADDRYQASLLSQDPPPAEGPAA